MPPVTTRVPSGLNATLYTLPVCPFSSTSGSPVAASRTVAALPEWAVAIQLTSRLNATPRTASPPRSTRTST